MNSVIATNIIIVGDQILIPPIFKKFKSTIADPSYMVLN